ncbi:MAG: hypothetical protein ACO3ND_08505 [Opitutales bacterium]
MPPASPCLVLDGSARDGLRAGVSADGRWISQAVSEHGALESAAGCAAEALRFAGINVAGIRSFALCAGPGSILGVRITAMMVRAWIALEPRPCFVWNGLQAIALAAVEGGMAPPFAVVAESRLRRWNTLPLSSDGVHGACVELEAGQVASLGLPLVGPAGAPFATRPAPDVWPLLPALFAQGRLLRAEDRPDALNPASDFAVWSGDRHRAPR